MSIVSSVTTAIAKPISSTPAHMRASIVRSVSPRGLRAMTSSVSGSTPIARAGPESVIRLIHRICVASSGSTTASPEPVSPITPAPTTPRKTVSTSPMFEDSR